MVAAAVAGSAIVGGVLSSNAASDAADTAAGAQRDSAQLGINEQRRQFDAIQKLLSPYATGGEKAFGGQQDIAGLNGFGAQQAAIQAIQQSPAFQSALKFGENSILQNASATGGLRGGNTQAALAQFSPQLLAQSINDQYARLGGISSLGQNAAAMTGNAGMQTGNNVANLMQQQGAATAGGALEAGRAQAGIYNSIGSGLGLYAGLGGTFPSFGGGGISTPGNPSGNGYFGGVTPPSAAAFGPSF